jgi:hypothetical protein
LVPGWLATSSATHEANGLAPDTLTVGPTVPVPAQAGATVKARRPAASARPRTAVRDDRSLNMRASSYIAKSLCSTQFGSTLLPYAFDHQLWYPECPNLTGATGATRLPCVDFATIGVS